MKYVFLALLSCVVATTVVYGIGAFVYWDTNPGNWDTSARAFASVFLLFGCYFAMYAAVTLTDK